MCFKMARWREFGENESRLERTQERKTLKYQPAIRVLHHSAATNLRMIGWLTMASKIEWNSLLTAYPQSMSKDKFFRICHISKRHAKYLLDSGLVPCVDSGKKTRKYTIRTQDVLTYLTDREQNPEKYRAPEGYYIGNSGKGRNRRRGKLASATQTVKFSFTDEEQTALYKEWEKQAEGYQDLLTVAEVCKLTGYTSKTVLSWCSRKGLVSFRIHGQYLAPKLSLLEYIAGKQATAIVRKSKKRCDVLWDFARNCHDRAVTY